jgi:Holliday junction resolvasome RuvABC ATP-dependent DNA helicase subunit
MTIPTHVIGQREALRTLEAISPTHVLFVGIPGMGKTHIALWHAAKLVSGNVVKVDSSVSTWSRKNLLTDDDVLLIDATDLNTEDGWWYERHAKKHLGPVVVDEVQVARNAEKFYPMIDKPIVGSKVYLMTTTDEGELPPALLSRMRIIALKPYTYEELAEIGMIGMQTIPPETALEIAKIARGSPRRMKFLTELLNRTGNKHRRTIWPNDVRGLVKHFGYPEGLTSREVEMLKALEDRPRSISTLAALMATGRNTVRLWETELVYAGLMTITSRGRALTEWGNVKHPNDALGDHGQRENSAGEGEC